MSFFRRPDNETPEVDAARARIEAGGITPQAEARLKALSVEGAMFTSGLSVSEFALLHRLGPQPLAQVMGASVVRPGWQYLPALPPGEVSVAAGPWGPVMSSTSLGNRMTEPSPQQVRNFKWHAEIVCELNTRADAWNLARRRALDRLSEEALQVGADAVVGVHLRRGDHDLGGELIDYVVSGTAVRLPDSRRNNWPVLTDVSVQDYWRLVTGGHEPRGLVAASAVVFASAPLDTRLRRTRTMARNQELAEISEAFHMARETVRRRIRSQVQDAQATGAVGVEFSHAVHQEKIALASSLQTYDFRGWNRGRFGIPYWVSGHSDTERRGWVITMHAAGTAIRSRPGRPAPPTLKTTMRMGAT
ncbi:MAG: hypothetical protein QOF83_620 [Solirubrobacteraceae bacterium]|jgi:uncharacterized protein YbjQ (UPF0145 family)|nr:hypothetical protein [Solirubrobacteraceae bacterium]